MNKISIISLICLTFIGVGCRNQSAEEHSHNHSHDHDHAHSEHDASHSHADEHEHEDGVITMSPDDAAFFGVLCETVNHGEFSDVIIVPGELEMQPDDSYNAVALSNGIVKLTTQSLPGNHVAKGSLLATVSARNIAGGDPNASAYEAMVAAKKELDRLAPLHEDGIVSTRDYNAAEAAYRQAKVAYSGTEAGSSVSSGISGTVVSVNVSDGAYVESGDIIATIAKNERLVLRADVPVRGRDAINHMSDANIRFTGSDSVFSMEQLNGRRINGNVSSLIGSYLPVYYTLDNPGNLVSGLTAEVFIHLDKRNDVITVPVESVSEQQGAKFVYVKLDEDCYKKIPVVVGRNDGRRVEITSGLSGGESVVADGMVFVKLAESNGAVPEGHSHSH